MFAVSSSAIAHDNAPNFLRVSAASEKGREGSSVQKFIGSSASANYRNIRTTIYG